LDSTSAEVRTGSAEVRTGRFGGEPEKYWSVQAPVSLQEVLGQAPPWSDLVQAVISGLSSVVGGEWYRGELREPERVKSDTLVERYGSAEWTWRR
jgi:hypothetical protein